MAKVINLFTRQEEIQETQEEVKITTIDDLSQEELKTFLQALFGIEK